MNDKFDWYYDAFHPNNGAKTKDNGVKPINLEEEKDKSIHNSDVEEHLIMNK